MQRDPRAFLWDAQQAAEAITQLPPIPSSDHRGTGADAHADAIQHSH
jgi:hypothetical protein